MRDPIRVLVADESRAIRLLLTSLLRDDARFVVVDDVASGTAVRARLDEVDLVVLDVVLEDGDAFTVIHDIRRHAPGVAAVVVAAVDPPYLRAEAMAHGAHGYFTHATDPHVLLAGFEQAVESASRERDAAT